MHKFIHFAAGTFLFLVIQIAMADAATAQMPPLGGHPPIPSREWHEAYAAMESLSFLRGTWTGNGVLYEKGVPVLKLNNVARQVGSFPFQKSVLNFAFVGKSASSDPFPLEVDELSYDSFAHKYRLAAMGGGTVELVDVQLIERNKLTWVWIGAQMQINPESNRRQRRITISVVGDVWDETDEFAGPNGTWILSQRATLHRVGPGDFKWPPTIGK